MVTDYGSLREYLAQALSIPEHHTSWELLSAVEQDRFHMQADYALKAMSADVVEALDMLVRVVDVSRDDAGLAITNASLLRAAMIETPAPLSHTGSDRG